MLWEFFIVTESNIISRMSIGEKITGLEVLNGDSVDIGDYTEF